jgi:hypothetical protein
MKYCVGRNEFLTKARAGSVDELQETAHNDLVGFCGHSPIYSILSLAWVGDSGAAWCANSGYSARLALILELMIPS